MDFNDGATQLQFCSDKCLNQYKMQIFCRETQAHLDLNPHLREKVEVVGASGERSVDAMKSQFFIIYELVVSLMDRERREGKGLESGTWGKLEIDE